MGGESAEPLNIPLLKDLPKDSPESNGYFRTGTIWTAIAHIITGVIGSGVLSLAWSVAQLGWIAGPVCMLLFAAITLLQSSLLADCYRSPDPDHGPIRNNSYMKAVRTNLVEVLPRSGFEKTCAPMDGKETRLLTKCERNEILCGIIQQITLFGTGVAYTITSSTSMRAIKKSDCYHTQGHDAPCSFSVTYFMVIFGAVQIFLSQIPDFHNMEWLSIMAAVMSFCYSFIGFALGFAKVIANRRIKGGIGGVSVASPTQKVWRVSQALGDIAFAYPYSLILLDIQDTLRSPPPENQTMKKASAISILITTFFYLACGCFGYAAFGDDTPGNLLTGFGFYEPYWLIDFANACIVLHLVGGYQMYSQPFFAFADRWVAARFPNSGFVNDFHSIKLPFLPPCKLNLFRLCFRTVYVTISTLIAMAFPYFNDVLGVLGALNFWPLAIYFPVEMYFVQRKIGSWTRRWIVLEAFSIVCLLLSIFALVGSVEGLFSAKLS